MSAPLAAPPVSPPHAAPPLVVRDVSAGRNADRFFVSAIATVLVIRGFLAATGYPSIGGSRLHVAHVLWGGLALAVTVLLQLISISRRIRPFAAVIGGVGFGFFIDELGKFLTRDVDYFYQPTIALIYFVFVVMFLALRASLSRRALTNDERLANVIVLMGDVAYKDLDVAEKAQAAALLDGCDPADPRVATIRGIIDRLEAVPAPPPGTLARAKRALAAHVERLVSEPRFARVVSVLFLLQAVAGLVSAVLTARGLWTVWHDPSGERHLGAGIASWGEIGSTLVSIGLVLAGVARLLHSRAGAFRMFRRALRVSIFVTQFFVFYDDQLAGMLGLAFNVVLLGVVDYLLAREETVRAGTAAATR